MSILLLFRRGGSDPGAAAIHGGHFIGRKRRRFDDLERRRRLRKTIEDLIDEPIVLVSLAPYLHKPTSAQAARPKLNWAKIYQNMGQIEENLAFLQKIVENDRSIDDDDEEMIGLM